MSVEPFVSLPGNARVSSWAKLGDLWISAAPLIDTAVADQADAPIYCRFTWNEADQAAALLGARLPTAAEIDAIRDDALSPGGVICAVHNLPDVPMIQAAGIAIPNWKDAAAVAVYQRQVGVVLNANMAGAPWCAIHDARAREDMKAAGFDGTRPALNAGKWYCKGLNAARPNGPPAGRAWLKGWWLPGHWIQAGPSAETDEGPHSDVGSRDYGTLTMVCRDTPPEGT